MLDQIQTWLIKESRSELLPVTTYIINSSLRSTKFHEVGCSHSIAKEIYTKPRYFEELPSCQQPLLHLKTAGEGGGKATN